MQLMALTCAEYGATIPPVSKKDEFYAAESFGAWLKYLRSLTRLNQLDAAKKAKVSHDAVKRMEGGQLVGSAHLLAWLSWLEEMGERGGPEDDIDASVDADTLNTAMKEVPDKLMMLGVRIREAGLAIQTPKGRRIVIDDASVPSGQRALTIAAAELSHGRPAASDESPGAGGANMTRTTRAGRATHRKTRKSGRQ